MSAEPAKPSGRLMARYRRARSRALAAEHDLSPEYVDIIRAVEAVHDPNETRRAANEQILYPDRAGRMRVR